MTFLRAVLAGMVAVVTFSQTSMAQAAEAESPLVWQFTTFKESAAQNVDAAQLNYGIPETDAIQAAATCNALSAAKISLSLSANVTVPDKSKLSVKIFGRPMNAIAIIPESGEGLSGFGVDLPANDPLLAKLVAKPSLTYSFKGGPERTIPLSKGKSPIKKFIQACKSFAPQAKQ